MSKKLKWEDWRKQLTKEELDRIIFEVFDNQVEDLLFEYYKEDYENV